MPEPTISQQSTILPFSPGSMSAVFGVGEDARQAVQLHFGPKLSVDPALTRQMVSYQANKTIPGLRWLKYREGFSVALLEYLYRRAGWDGSQAILDPFSGIGTTPLTASIAGEGVGIELMPVGPSATRAIAACTTLPIRVIRNLRDGTLDSFRDKNPDAKYSFRHVPITDGAFPPATGRKIACLRKFAAGLPKREGDLVRFVGMSVLEEVSYTRKDGQYLRWDARSGRANAKLDKGRIPAFEECIEARFAELDQDIAAVKQRFNPARIKLIEGSCLEKLLSLPDDYFDGVITSPPYANRYDYTRTYALELAYCGYNKEDFRNLRQTLLSATVENKSKRQWLREVFAKAGHGQEIASVFHAVDENKALAEVLASLRFAEKRGDLPNANVIQLVENYFLEMAVVIAQLNRVLKPNGTVFMVNDNVQYSGEEVPVDLILSQIAERRGFAVERIWVLPRGKGNASQQMGRYGRREIRKCVYQWRKQG